MCIMPAPEENVLRWMSEAMFLGSWTIEHYILVALLQCLLNAVLSALVCSITMAVSAWLPHKFTVLCMPILIFFINITLATYVLKLPGIFDWDNVFLLLVGGSKTLEVFLIKLIFNILFWMGLSAILFMYKVKERYQNE